MQKFTKYKPGDYIGSRYLVHQALTGGVAEVYLCLDTHDNTPYALKTFQTRFAASEKLEKLFRSEVSIWISLENHPNIVRCYYMKSIDNQQFMFLDWIIGDDEIGLDLRAWIDRGPLPVNTALIFLLDICRGLQHANKKQSGIVHRDLKPDNILISKNHLAKITDFGLAKVMEEVSLSRDQVNNTSQKNLNLSTGGGTPPYMAPEQWKSQELDCRTDIYALGCVLFEMLTGQKLFSGSTILEYFQEHTKTDPASRVAEQIFPDVLKDIIRKCVAKKKENRFTSIDEFTGKLLTVYQNLFNAQPREIALIEELAGLDYENRAATYERLNLTRNAINDYIQTVYAYNFEQEWYQAPVLLSIEKVSYEDELETLNQSVALAPNFAPSYYNRGRCHLLLKNYVKAIEDFSATIRLNAKNYEAYYQRGLANYQLGNYEQALKDFDVSIKQGSNDPLIIKFRASIFNRIHMFQQAIEEYSRIILRDPLDIIGYLGRGATLCHLERFDEALRDYFQALKIDQDSQEANLNVGVILASRNLLPKAMLYLAKAAQLGSPIGLKLALLVRKYLQSET